jgi:predicted transcriptional regulator/CRISPR/Cas system-associated endoribonuclease Cas2
MARIFTPLTLEILSEIQKKPEISPKEIHRHHVSCDYKELYNTIFRLANLELIKKQTVKGEISLTITQDGEKALQRNSPKPDGVWKLVIFDIPEKQKYVRVVLRAKLKALHFKKWQNSIWVSPYALDEEIEAELDELGKKFFVRLIKTKEINLTDDLEKMFLDTK